MSKIKLTNNTIMPQFRKAAAKSMSRDYGMKQEKIAKILGITQAAVSKCINSRGPAIGINKKDVDAFIQSVIAGNELNAREIICKICKDNKSFECAAITIKG